jgi:Ala-tRNA(Pro) deacylase
LKIGEDLTEGEIRMDTLHEFFTAKDITDLFNKQNISFELYPHEPANTIEDLDALEIPHKESIVKNLFLRDDKKKKFYLVILSGHKKVDLKMLGEKIPSRRLSFASEDILYEKMFLKKGHVTPLGILNNKEKNIIVVFDENLKGQIIGVHPMENNKTVFLRFEALVQLIKNNGNIVLLCNI